MGSIDLLGPPISENEICEKRPTAFELDSYNEDSAEVKALKAKPTCFVVIGKPGSGKTALAKMLAAEWKCELVSATQTITQEVELQTEKGKQLQGMLLRGEAIPEAVAAEVVINKINSEEVQHHGYVLDDLPTLSEEYMSLKDQIEMVKSWKLKPDFIVHMKLPDKDLETRRVFQRVDQVTGIVYTKEIYDPDKPPKPEKKATDEEEEEEEEDVEEEEEEEENPNKLPPEVIERLVKRPEDLPDHITENLKKYRTNAMRLLEDFMADHDQQYLIELDANKPLAMLFQELMSRLECFVLRRAAVVQKIYDPEDEEIPEEIETEDLMRAMANRKVPAPRFRWRRSRWLRYCPVALAEGNLVPGKPELTVSFMDKMYVLSSDLAMEKFMKNPRNYLLEPQPTPPCKFIVIGPPMSGKTTLANKLAEKYKGTVIDIASKMEPKIEEARKNAVETARTEALDHAIAVVKQKLKDQYEAEKAAAKAEEDHDTEDVSSGREEEEGQEGAEQEKTDEAKPEGMDGAETVSATETDKPERTVETEESQPTVTAVESKESEPWEQVDADHPEVIEMVASQVEIAEKSEINMTADQWIDLMEEVIKETEALRREKNPQGQINGGWILDNFPQKPDQWNVLMEKGQEKGIMPDNVFVLRDESEGGITILNRWYLLNREEVDNKIKNRVEREEELKRLKEEEARKQAEEAERKKKEEMEKALAAARKQARQEELEKRVAAGEEQEAVEAELAAREEAEEKVRTKKASLAEQATKRGSASARTAEEVISQQGLDHDPSAHQVPSEMAQGGVVLPNAPEIEEQRDIRRQFDADFQGVLPMISQLPTEVVYLELHRVKEDEESGEKTESEPDIEAIFQECIAGIEGRFRYAGWEMAGVDMDEEDEDNDAAGAEEEEMGEEEQDEAEGEEPEEDPNRSLKKFLGDTSWFCPVALKEQQVLWPGNPEIAAKYREKTYYLSTPEARERFLEKPQDYLPISEPYEVPPIRLLILGAKGAGKSLHGRHLALKYNLFHIQYKERLQELVFKKTKKKIGPEYEDEEEEEEEPEPPEDDDEDESELEKTEDETTEAITAPSNVDKPADKLNEEGEEAEEEPLYNEEEEAIVNYLKEDEPLPPELLEKIIVDWWKKEPFKSQGFILEGFPRNTEEMEFMAEKGLFPDGAVILNAEDSDVISRLLPPKMARWKEKMDKKLARRKKKKEKAAKKRQKAIEKRKAEIIKELTELKEQEKAERLAAKAEEEDEEDEVEDEEEEEEEDMAELVEERLAEEFPDEEEEEEEDDETEEDARDRLTNGINEIYDKDTNGLATVQDRLEEMLIPKFEVESGKKTHIIRYIINKKLKKVIDFRHSTFERVYPLSERVAKQLVTFGYKQPSSFGRWCPVKLKDGECIQPVQGPGHSTFPALYRSFIYFLSSKNALERFSLDPMSFLQQPIPKPVVPIRIAVVGPPKSGKTALANRLSQEYGLVRLSMGEALRMLVANQPKTTLAKAILGHLKKGLTVPDDLAVQALEVAIMDMKCQVRGYILDGYPLTQPQVDLMRERSILPVRVIELQVDSKELVTRATRDRYAPTRQFAMHDSPQIMAVKLAAWQKEVAAVKEYYEKTHNNWMVINGDKSKWFVANHVKDIGHAAVKQIQNYISRMAEGKSASIANMCITPKEFEERLGPYGHYCPVRLAAKNELVDCSKAPTLQHAVEFRGRYYRVAGNAELTKFLQTPEMFVPPDAPRPLPTKDFLPIRRTAAEAKAMFPTPIQLQGYCSVTFKDGKQRYEAIVEGDPELVVEYRGKLYYFVDEEKLDKFMRLPEDYWDLKLPHKLPPKPVQIQVANLPMLGFLEQTVAQAITRSLTACGNIKPKYPFLSPSKSALVYIGYHLKAYNPRSSDYIRKKYKKKLMDFEDTCELIHYLGNVMTKKYKEPKDRPIDFDFKMEKFIALKDIALEQSGSTWIK